MGPKRKSRVLPRAYNTFEPPIQILDSQVPFRDHIDPEPSIQMLNSDKVVSIVGGPSRRDEDPLRGLSHLCQLQLSGNITMIHGFSYTARSSRHSKCYNAPTSIQTVIYSGRYLCMTIPTIKRRDLDSYEKITTCNYAVMKIQNFRTLNYNSNIYIYFSISIEKRVHL